MTIKFAHIINPVVVAECSDLYAAQPVTFESMRLAQAQAEGVATVELYAAQFPEDAGLIPSWFTQTRDLDCSVLDFGTFQRSRKLPLIKDILDRLYEVSQADYFIYTNVDISLQPYFYTVIVQLIEEGYDGMVINRRTIAKVPNNPVQMPLLWAQIGEDHPGYDCFVFRRDVYPDFQLGTACIGANWIGRVLLANVCLQAKKFKIFKDLHLSFHLGDDRSWKIPDFNDYDTHNERQLQKILEAFEGEGHFEDRPLLRGFLDEVYRNQGNNRNRHPKRRRWFRCG